MRTRNFHPLINSDEEYFVRFIVSTIVNPKLKLPYLFCTGPEIESAELVARHYGAHVQYYGFDPIPGQVICIVPEHDMSDEYEVNMLNKKKVFRDFETGEEFENLLHWIQFGGMPPPEVDVLHLEINSPIDSWGIDPTLDVRGIETV